MVLVAWSIGTIIGPVVGASLVETSSWRWCFHINYPFCGIGFVVTILIVRLKAVGELTVVQKLKRVDWVGIFLFVGGMTGFLIGLSWGGIQYAWRSAETLAPILLGVFGLTGFFGWQLYRKEHTLLPLAIFTNWSAMAAFYSALINGVMVSFIP
jgi:MFS family permease